MIRENRDGHLLNRVETFIRLKEVVRSGWELRGVSQPESVADHSWGTAMLCLLLAPPELDRARTVAMALVHDLAEVETGDIPRRVRKDAQPVTPGEKHTRERAAMRRLTRWDADEESITTVPPVSSALEEVSALWEEYETGSSREACFVRDMNLIDMCLQALVYERDRRYDPDAENGAFPDYRCLDEFFATSRDRIRTELGISLFAAIESRYCGIRDKREGADQR
jgi:putative hydrolases of HD superfamily